MSFEASSISEVGRPLAKGIIAGFPIIDVTEECPYGNPASRKPSDDDEGGSLSYFILPSSKFSFEGEKT